MKPLEALKRESRLSYQQIADGAGLSKGQVVGLIRRTYPYPQDGNLKRVRRLLVERARLQRSRAPEFLAQIRQVTIPLLEDRLNGRTPT